MIRSNQLIPSQHINQRIDQFIEPDEFDRSFAQSSVSDLLKVSIPDVPDGKQPIRILICGIPQGVNHIIHQLHVCQFAEAGEWSPPLPSAIEGEVIRILIRYYMR